MNTPCEVNVKLSRYDDSKAMEVVLQKSIIISLIYFTSTRWDINYTIGLVFLFMHKPPLRGSSQSQKEETKVYQRHLSSGHPRGRASFSELYLAMSKCPLVGDAGLWLSSLCSRFLIPLSESSFLILTQDGFSIRLVPLPLSVYWIGLLPFRSQWNSAAQVDSIEPF